MDLAALGNGLTGNKGGQQWICDKLGECLYCFLMNIECDHLPVQFGIVTCLNAELNQRRL